MKEYLSKIHNKIINTLLIKGKNERNNDDFSDLAMEIFQYQYQNNQLYHRWVNMINGDNKSINSIEEIPFLPIQLFKNHDIKTGNWQSEKVFESSGTTSKNRSKHHIRSIIWYKKIAKTIFENFFNSIDEYTIIALLPAYLDNPNSSLITMLNHFICSSKNKHSGFYIKNTDNLQNIIASITNQKIILWGVTYALIKIEKLISNTNNLTVIETGGMKGMQKEIIREELHDNLCKTLKVNNICSEYGMTELLSQAYAKDNGNFVCPNTMKVLVRDINDPLCVNDNGKGALNIVDLANVDTCSFIATDDIGHVFKQNNNFNVLGRLDNSDIRGCNTLI